METHVGYWWVGQRWPELPEWQQHLQTINARGEPGRAAPGPLPDGVVHLRVGVGVDGATVDVTAFASTDGVVVELPLKPSDDGAQVAEVTARREDGASLRAEDLMRLGLGAVHGQLRDHLKNELLAAQLGHGWGAERLPRPGRRGRHDLFYAEAAAEYVHALTQDATRPVRWILARAAEEGRHLTADEVRARVRRARERGLLTPTPKGRPGGELTKRCRDLLREAGMNVEEES